MKEFYTKYIHPLCKYAPFVFLGLLLGLIFGSFNKNKILNHTEQSYIACSLGKTFQCGTAYNATYYAQKRRIFLRAYRLATHKDLRIEILK